MKQKQRAAVLFSGGKDSCYAAFLASKKYKIECLISVFSQNLESYMFHTPNIGQVKKQAQVMKLPLVIQTTKGQKEIELKDLEKVIKKAKDRFKVEVLVTGAIKSVYQASRIQKICEKLNLKCFSPLWHKNEFKYLNELIKNKFKVIVIGVFAEPFNQDWLGKEINENFVKDIKKVHQIYKIHPAGEGGEFETFVLNCPLFKRELKIIDKKISGEKHSWKMDVEVE